MSYSPQQPPSEWPPANPGQPPGINQMYTQGWVGMTPPPPPATIPATTGWIVAAAGAAVILGSFLPWGSITAPFIGTYSISGVDGADGWITAVVGALLAAYGMVVRARRLPVAVDVLVLLGGLAVAAVAGWKILELQRRVTDMRAEMPADREDVLGLGAAMAEAVQVRVGAGLWLLAAAGLAAAVAVGVGLYKRS